MHSPVTLAPPPVRPAAAPHGRAAGSGFGAAPPGVPGGRDPGSGTGGPPAGPGSSGGGSAFTTPYVYVALPVALCPFTVTVTATLPAACVGVVTSSAVSERTATLVAALPPKL